MGANMDVNLRLRVKEMAWDSELTERQRERVVTIASIPSMLGEDVPKSITLMIAMSTTSYFKDLNESKKNNKELGGFQAVLKEMNATPEKNFSFTPDQESDIHALLRYHAWNPYCLNHRKGLEECVLKYIVKNAEALGFAHITKRPHCVLLLKKEIGDKARQVRNLLRQQVQDSVDIQNVVPLQTFVSQLGPKFVYPGAEGYASNGVTLSYGCKHLVICRHFVVENPDIVWAEDESTQAMNQEPVQKRARKTNVTKAAGGRVAKGQDFWSLFNRFMQDKVKELGSKISEPRWNSYIAELCGADRAHFPGRLTASEAKKRRVDLISPVQQTVQVTATGGHTSGFLGTVLS
ncbi:hypothetical protein PQX77_017441 [Marasmius sp. AFHP31]|nr:hypothetical protein PQX77_017441 [Marasmius sp. AFHP31]